jgi:SAM-dependent methyltransferase/glycosyltransferase involved in cell wall biosynthesis
MTMDVAVPMHTHAATASAPPRVLVLCERLDATYAINFGGTLAALSQQGAVHADVLTAEMLAALPDREALFGEVFGRHRPTLIVASRLADRQVLALSQEARRRGVTFVMHLDDLVFELPDHLGASYRKSYGPGYLVTLDAIVAASHALWASTPTLAEALRQRFPRQTVQELPGVLYLPHAVAPSRLRRVLHTLRHKRGAPTFGFMGSRSHQAELDQIAPAIAAVLERVPHARFEVLGCAMPAELERFGQRATRYGYVAGYEQLIARLYELNWDVGLVPLFDHAFNRSKTCTKFLEYTAAGIATMASRVGMYATSLPDGVVRRCGPHNGEWIDGLAAWLTDLPAARATLLCARQHCERHHDMQTAAAALHRTLMWSITNAPAKEPQMHTELSTAPNLSRAPTATCRMCDATGEHERFVATERLYGLGGEFPYFRCSACGSMQIADVPANLADHYPSNYYSFSASEPEVEELPWLRRMLRARRAAFHIDGKDPIGRLVDRLGPSYFSYPWRWFAQARVSPGSAILDVGCGSGALLRALRAQGFTNLTGVDPFIAQPVREPHLRIEKCELRDLTGSFDLVMLHHSLEHVPNPREQLRAAAARLAPGGALLLRIPIADGSGWRMYGTHWFALDAPRHLVIPSRASLQQFAQTCGLELEHMYCDSEPVLFWGSELYKRGMPMMQPDGRNTLHSHHPFTDAEMAEFQAKTEQLNSAQDGDLACFVFRKPVGA